MKKYFVILAVALACLATACTDNILPIDPEEPDAPKVTYIKANANEDATKASIDGTDGTFTWSAGDQIAVFNMQGTTAKYSISDPLADTDAGNNTALFSFSGENAVNENGRQDFAIYPASLVSSTNSQSYHTASNFWLVLPDSYNLDQVMGEKSPVPMIATNQPNGELSFKQLCALLRVTVKDIPAQTRRLEFAFSNDVKVAGPFRLTNGVEYIATPRDIYHTAINKNTITILMPSDNVYRNEVDINLPVPTILASDTENSYNKLTVTAYNSANEAILKITSNIRSNGAAWKPARRAARKMTAALPVFTINSGGKKVTFAPGNLQWVYKDGINGNKYTHAVNLTNSESYNSNIYDTKSYNGGMFFFASEQYETAGVNNWPNLRINLTTNTDENIYQAERNLSEFYLSNDGVLRRVDLFLFASSGYRGSINSKLYYHYKPFAVCNAGHWASNGDYGNGSHDINDTNYDWGYFNAISKNQDCTEFYEPGVWGLMKIGEWTYLLNDRPGAKQKRGFAKIHNTCGLIILPDNWSWTPSHPQEPFVPFETAIGDDDPSSLTITWTPYRDEDWETMEAAGAVFLPAAGSINPNQYSDESDNGHVVNWGVGNNPATASGYYWTSSAVTVDNYNSRYSYCIDFGTESNGTHWRTDKSERHWGRAVRLVRRLN